MPQCERVKYQASCLVSRWSWNTLRYGTTVNVESAWEQRNLPYPSSYYENKKSVFCRRRAPRLVGTHDIPHPMYPMVTLFDLPILELQF